METIKVPRSMHATTTMTNTEFCPLPPSIVTPVFVERLSLCLHDHPDQNLVNYILDGFSHGFDIGFTGSFSNQNTRPRNLPSARRNPSQVGEAIRKEINRGHMSGPFSGPPFKHTHCSPIGSAPNQMVLSGSFSIFHHPGGIP